MTGSCLRFPSCKMGPWGPYSQVVVGTEGGARGTAPCPLRARTHPTALLPTSSKSFLWGPPWSSSLNLLALKGDTRKQRPLRVWW